MGFSPSPKSSPGGVRSTPSPSGHRTLTPNRKHRKMLKDGTSEVWPESVEKIFVDGLRQYWESPWATYSRGRSRWRNQFLVDYLKEAGIERSKKQVASHIQVLRNMWKGEKEYELVAGGEELFQENGLLAHKPGATHVSPSSDVRVKEECRDVQSPLAPRTPSDSSDFQSENDESAGGLDALHALDAPDERTPAAFLASVPLAHNPQQPRSAIKDEGYDLHLPGTVPPISSLMTTSVAPPHIVRNSVAGVTLSAAGMRPLHIEVDQYAPPSPTPTIFSPRVSIHIKLSLSSLHDVSSPPALHGFSGTVTFAAPWTSVAQCVTRVFAGGVCESVEYAYFEPAASLSPLSMAPVTVPLPESELSRCRWGNIGVETRIDQVVTVDHEEVAWIAYDLTWTASGPPSAEILNVQRDPQEHPQQQQQQLVSAPTPVPEPASFLSVNSWNSEPSYAPYASYVPRSQEPPIAYSPYSCLAGSPNGDQQYTQYSSVLFS